MAHDNGDKLLEASAINNLGIVQQHLGDGAAALEYYRKGLELYRETGEPSFCAVSLVNIAEILLQTGDLAAAGEHCRQALDLFNAYGDRHGAVSARRLAGCIHRDQGDVDRALEDWHQSLATAQEIGDSENELRALTDIAMALLALGRTEDALEHLDLAQVIAAGVRDLPTLETLYGAYAELYGKLGDGMKSSEYARKREDVERELHSQAG